MDSHWDADRLDVFFQHLLTARLEKKVKPLRLVFHALRTRLLNRQTIKRGAMELPFVSSLHVWSDSALKH